MLTSSANNGKVGHSGQTSLQLSPAGVIRDDFIQQLLPLLLPLCIGQCFWQGHRCCAVAGSCTEVMEVQQFVGYKLLYLHHLRTALCSVATELCNRCRAPAHMSAICSCSLGLHTWRWRHQICYSNTLSQQYHH